MRSLYSGGRRGLRGSLAALAGILKAGDGMNRTVKITAALFAYFFSGSRELMGIFRIPLR